MFWRHLNQFYMNTEPPNETVITNIKASITDYLKNFLFVNHHLAQVIAVVLFWLHIQSHKTGTGAATVNFI